MEASAPSPLSSIEIVRLLAESARRAVVAALVLAPDGATVDELVAITSLSRREVMSALDRLSNGGLVAQRADGYELVHDVFQRAARAEVPPAEPSAHGDLPDDEARVLDAAFVDGKLVNFPAKRSKRLIVLDFLAQQFEIGTHYPERDVNEILAHFDPDVAMLRRWLVDERFLDRDGGRYWRCGGTV